MNLLRRHRWILEVAVVLALVLAVTTWQTRHLAPTGEPAPAFRLEALDGSSVSLESLRGKRVLLHFWATWCGVCRQELSALSAVHRSLGANEALVTVVADSGDADAVRQFGSEHGLAYPILLGTPEILREYRVGAFPTNYYLDERGVVRGRTVGMSTRWAMQARLALAR